MAKFDSTRLFAGAMMAKVRGNARRRGIPVSITVDDIDAMMRAQGMRCAVSGIKFSSQRRPGGGRVRPFVPSVDRIDAKLGYEIGNIRVVCAAVNAALGDWGDELFHQIVLGVANKHRWAAQPGTRVYPRGVVGRKHPNGTRYEALIAWKGQRYFLGTFPSPEAAGEHYAAVRARLLAGDDVRTLLRPNSKQKGIKTRTKAIGIPATDGTLATPNLS
jgi:hypothetical protein